MKIKSVLHGDRVYELQTSYMDLWDRKGQAPLSTGIGAYETYGDGLTQHAPTYCPQWSELTDVCLSLAGAILEDPKNECWDQLRDSTSAYGDEALRFALTVQYKEGKDQWYSLAERKVTTSEKKRHDRRYEQIHDTLNGTPQSALNILCREKGYDWLVRIGLAERLRELHQEQGGGYMDWETIFPPVKELAGDWHQAFRAFNYALQGTRLLYHSKRFLENAINNSKRKEQAA